MTEVVADAQVCATVSTAYVHGGRPGLLPEDVVDAAAPPSLWHPLVPILESTKADAPLCNGHSAEAGDASVTVCTDAAPAKLANGNGRKASIPGRYLDLDTELVYARVRLLHSDIESFHSCWPRFDLERHNRA